MLIKDIALIRSAVTALLHLINEGTWIDEADKQELTAYVHRLYSLERWIVMRIERGDHDV